MLALLLAAGAGLLVLAAVCWMQLPTSTSMCWWAVASLMWWACVT
jgi:hypothetical protein